MGKASSAKKVARAARAGGGRRAGQQRNWVFPGAVAIIAILGVLLVAFARDEGSADADIPPVINEHWHAAYGINICGEWDEPLVDTQNDRLGIHTHEDGIIHIHPFSSAGAGEKAQIGKFFDEVGLDVSDDSIEFGGSDDEFKTGEDKCGDEDASVRLLQWDGPDDEEPVVITEDITDTRFTQDRQVFALVFGPEDLEVEQPPSVPNLDNLTDVPPTDPFAADPNASVPLSIPEAEEGDDSTTSSSGPEGEEADESTTSSSEPEDEPEDESTTTTAP